MQQIFVAPLVPLPHLARRLQQPHRLQQQIVEIQRIVLGHLLAIGLKNMRNPLRTGVRRAKVILLRIDHVALGPRNLA